MLRNAVSCFSTVVVVVAAAAVVVVASKGKLPNFSLHEIVEQVKYPGVVSHSVRHEVRAGKTATQYEQQGTVLGSY